MNLKYERQWEIVEKIFKNEQNIYRIPTPKEESDRREAIITNCFELYKFTNIFVFWKLFEDTVRVLHLHDWEYQQKPLLDKMIEVSLWNRDNKNN